MSVTEDQVYQALSSELKTTNIKVIDESDGCGDKFMIYISTALFDNVKLLQRQRMVYDALSEYMPNIHAVSMKTWTSSQWEKKKDTIPGL